MRVSLKVAVLACFAGLAGCDDGNAELDEQVSYWLEYHAVQPIEVEASDIQSPEAQLGKLLFFSRSLSGNDKVACVSCHHPDIGGDDDLPLSVGVNVAIPESIGRDRISLLGRPMVPRNAPTTFNSSLWQKRMFFDGRIERINSLDDPESEISTPDEKFGDVDLTATSLLQAQAGFPVISQHEMRATYENEASNKRVRALLVQNLIDDVKTDLASDPFKVSWDSLFAQTYGVPPDTSLTDLITMPRVQDLLAAYQSSQVFVNNPWQRYLQGDKSAISEDAKRGAVLFMKPVAQGGVGCYECHSGDLFSDEDFHVLAVPHAGKGKDEREADTGRFLRTGIFDDRFAFRTPSLLNVELTAPYGHSGVFGDLEGIIRHHLNPLESARNFDYGAAAKSQPGIAHPEAAVFTEMAIAHLQNLQKSGQSKIRPQTLSDNDIELLIAFIEAQTDPCAESVTCLAPWKPEPAGPNPGDSLLY